MTKDEIKNRLRNWINTDSEKLDDLMSDLLGHTDIDTITELLDEVSEEVLHSSETLQKQP